MLRLGRGARNLNLGPLKPSRGCADSKEAAFPDVAHDNNQVVAQTREAWGSDHTQPRASEPQTDAGPAHDASAWDPPENDENTLMAADASVQLSSAKGKMPVLAPPELTITEVDDAPPPKPLSTPKSPSKGQKPKLKPTPSGIPDEELYTRMKNAERSVKVAQQELLNMHRSPVPWTQTSKFTGAVGVVIVFNALCMGLEADYARAVPTLFEVLENIFAAVFLVEMILHFWVEGVRVYFADKANWLDCLLVVMSVTDVWIIQHVGINADMRLVSLMRLLRLTRLARLLRLFRLFKELTLIIEGFVGGARALTWAMMFLLIIVYTFAIFARLQIGGRYVCGDGETEPPEGDTCPHEAGGGDPSFVFLFNEEIGDQKRLFGSMDLTMLTLFICLTEGCGVEVIHPTVRRSPALAFFWIVFVLVTTFGILNLIIGIFCENMMKISLNTEREIMRSEEEARRQKIDDLRRAFQRMDKDCTGDITREEFAEAIVENADVINALTSLGLDEERDLFDAIDADHSGTLEFNEFFDGVTLIMKGQEPALAKDMVATYLRVSALYKAHQRLEQKLQSMQTEHQQALARIDTNLANVRDGHLRALSRIEQRLDLVLGIEPPSGPAPRSKCS